MILSVSTKRAIISSVILTIWLRFVYFFIGYIMIQLDLIFPVPKLAPTMNFYHLIPPPASPWFTLIQPLHRFDALWYEMVAKTAYTGIPPSAAFFPLYPFLVQGIAQILHIAFAQSAYIINTILIFVFFCLLYRITEEEYSTAAAERTLLLYSAFPVIFFFLAPYAEILFIACTLMSFYSIKKSRYLISAFFAALAAISKPYGIALIIPLSVYLFSNFSSLKSRLSHALPFLLVVVSYFSVIRFQDLSSGIFLSTFQSQKFWGIAFAWPWQQIAAELKYLSNQPYNLPNHLNILLMFAVIAFQIKARKQISSYLWWYTLTLALIFIFTSFKQQAIPLFSFSRYFLVLFPVFMFSASRKISGVFFWIASSSMTILGIVLFIFYSMGIFVA